MQPTLQAHRVSVVALSKDTPAQAAAHQARDHLTLTLLSDPKLAVIDQLGLLHRNGFEFVSWTVGGVPLGLPIGFREMAVPTTFLIDEAGVIRWMDQADDYRLRGDEQRIADALDAAFGKAP